MRADALRREDTSTLDIMSKYGATALAWLGAALTGMLAGFSAYETYKKMPATKQFNELTAMTDNLQKTKKKLERLFNKTVSTGSTTNDRGLIRISRTDYSDPKKWYLVEIERTRAVTEGERQELFALTRGKNVDDLNSTIKINEYEDLLDKQRTKITLENKKKHVLQQRLGT